jgi:hypothetical protein
MARIQQYVHRADGELATGPGVTFAAGAREVIGVDVGVGIAGRQDVMHTVAARAICDLLHAAAGREPMEAFLVRWDLVSRQAILLAEA